MMQLEQQQQQQKQENQSELNQQEFFCMICMLNIDYKYKQCQLCNARMHSDCDENKSFKCQCGNFGKFIDPDEMIEDYINYSNCQWILTDGNYFQCTQCNDILYINNNIHNYIFDAEFLFSLLHKCKRDPMIKKKIFQNYLSEIDTQLTKYRKEPICLIPELFSNYLQNQAQQQQQEPNDIQINQQISLFQFLQTIIFKKNTKQA